MKITHCLLIALSLLVGSPSHAGVWQTTSTMNTERGGAGVVEVEGRLYVIGGVDGIRYLRTSEYTTIQGDGSLSSSPRTSAISSRSGAALGRFDIICCAASSARPCCPTAY